MDIYFFDKIYKRIFEANIEDPELLLKYDPIPWNNIWSRILKPKNSCILVLGSGLGGLIKFIPDEGNEIVELDISLAGLKYSQQRNDTFHVCANALDRLPFQDESFDFIADEQLFLHIADEFRDSIFNEIFRTLKPGGLFLFYNVEGEIDEEMEKEIFGQKIKYICEKSKTIEILEEIGFEKKDEISNKENITIIVFKK